ncbi:MAG: hypothetical protein IJY39_03495 [Clostridia bacterium]|nr:hypothetical protein [Clostridia bacterium]
MFKKIISFILSALLLMGTLSTAIIAADDSTEGGTEAVNAQNLAKQLTEQVSDMAHPYILYTKDDVPALQKKVESGMSLKAFTTMKNTANSYLGKSISVAVGAHGTLGRQLQSWITYLSVTGMITGDQKYTKKAVSLAVSAAKTGSIEIYPKINDALAVGDFGHAYALAYDWLYEYMTEEERALIRAEMEEIGNWLYTKSPEVDTWGSQEARRKAWNWNAVTHGALGLIALSLGDKPEWLELSIDRAMGYYQYAVDGTGAAMEGLHYVGYAFNSLAPLDCAIYNLTGVELLDSFPAMQSMPYWSMNMTVPFGKAQAAIGQGDGIGNYSGPYYIINRYKQADALWGWIHTYGLSGDGRFSTEYEGNGWSMPAIIFFEDQSLTPVAPTVENNPLIQTYDKGLVIARDSWNTDASMVTFTCGYGYAGCWNHPDDNTFTFYAKGESFVVDLGAGKLQSSDHNVILVDGTGMYYTGGATMAVGVMEENAILENGALYLRGNNVSSYLKNSALTTSIRHFVYGGGETPFVLIFDYAKKASSKHTFSTNFYTYANNKVTVSEDGSYAIIEGKNTGALCYVIPFTPEGVTIDTKTTNGARGLCTSSTSTLHRQATVFITANPDGSMPKVEFSTEGKNTFVSITRTVNGESVTETYNFDMKELISPEIQTTEATTEVPTEVIESIESESVTVEQTEASDVEQTEAEPTESETDEKQAGCGSSVGAATAIPAVAATAAVLICKKKKKSEE